MSFDNTAPVSIPLPDALRRTLSVRLATTANIDTQAAVIGDVIDGVETEDGDIILVKNQTAGAENGIYQYSDQGLDRHASYNASSEVTTGLRVRVEEGTVAAGKAYVLTTAAPITLGTTALTFADFAPTAITPAS